MIAALRDWANSHTAEGRYSPVGVAFHWVMAALILFQLGWGWWMTRLPVGADKLSGYQLHSSVGLVILVLAILRFAWRLIVTDPVNDADRPGWQSKAAHVTAWAFYIAFFGLPLSGWAMWSALGDGAPLRLAGLLPWPDMPFEGLSVAWQWTVMDWTETIHIWLAWFTAALIPLHVGAALKHHFWDRHDVLEAMLPHVPDEEQRRTRPRHSRTPRKSRPASSPG